MTDKEWISSYEFTKMFYEIKLQVYHYNTGHRELISESCETPVPLSDIWIVPELKTNGMMIVTTVKTSA